MTVIRHPSSLACHTPAPPPPEVRVVYRTRYRVSTRDRLEAQRLRAGLDAASLEVRRLRRSIRCAISRERRRSAVAVARLAALEEQADGLVDRLFRLRHGLPPSPHVRIPQAAPHQSPAFEGRERAE